MASEMRPPEPTPTTTWVATAASLMVLPFEVVGRAVPAAQDSRGSPLALASTVVRLTTTARAVAGTGPPATRTEVPLTPTGRPATRLSQTRRGVTACSPADSGWGVAATQPTRSTTTSTDALPFVTTTAPPVPVRVVTVFATARLAW